MVASQQGCLTSSPNAKMKHVGHDDQDSCHDDEGQLLKGPREGALRVYSDKWGEKLGMKAKS